MQTWGPAAREMQRTECRSGSSRAGGAAESRMDPGGAPGRRPRGLHRQSTLQNESVCNVRRIAQKPLLRQSSKTPPLPSDPEEDPGEAGVAPSPAPRPPSGPPPPGSLGSRCCSDLSCRRTATRPTCSNCSNASSSARSAARAPSSAFARSAAATSSSPGTSSASSASPLPSPASAATGGCGGRPAAEGPGTCAAGAAPSSKKPSGRPPGGPAAAASPSAACCCLSHETPFFRAGPRVVQTRAQAGLLAVLSRRTRSPAAYCGG